MPYVPLGRALKVSATVGGAAYKAIPSNGNPTKLMADTNFRAADTFQSCQTNDTRRVGDVARCIGQVPTQLIFPALVRCFSYIIFRAAPIPLYGVTV